MTIQFLSTQQTHYIFAVSPALHVGEAGLSDLFDSCALTELCYMA